MPDNVRVRVNGLDRTWKRLARLPDEVFSDRNLNQLGSFFTATIKKRTAEGKDVDGRFFKPYTLKYEALRVLNGHSDSPNLFWTGSMMNAMTYKVDKVFGSAHSITLFFRDTEDKFGGRNPLKAHGLNLDRRFFDLSQEDLDQGANLLRSKIK